MRTETTNAQGEILARYPDAFACYSTSDGMFRVYADRERSAVLSSLQRTEALAWTNAADRLSGMADRVAQSIGVVSVTPTGPWSGPPVVWKDEPSGTDADE